MGYCKWPEEKFWYQINHGPWNFTDFEAMIMKHNNWTERGWYILQVFLEPSAQWGRLHNRTLRKQKLCRHNTIVTRYIKWVIRVSFSYYFIYEYSLNATTPLMNGYFIRMFIEGKTKKHCPKFGRKK